MEGCIFRNFDQTTLNSFAKILLLIDIRSTVTVSSVDSVPMSRLREVESESSSEPSHLQEEESAQEHSLAFDSLRQAFPSIVTPVDILNHVERESVTGRRDESKCSDKISSNNNAESLSGGIRSRQNLFVQSIVFTRAILCSNRGVSVKG